MKRLLELVVLLVAAMWPTFFFAGKIDGDEWLKAGSGTGTVLVIYAAWRKKLL